MPKIETFYEVDMRQIRDVPPSERHRLEETIRRRLVEKVAEDLLKGGHITFPPPDRLDKYSTLEYRAEFEFQELSKRQKDYIDYQREAVSRAFGNPIPSVYNNMRNFQASWVILDDPDEDKEPPPPQPTPKPPCKCNQYSFCPFLCK